MTLRGFDDMLILGSLLSGFSLGVWSHVAAGAFFLIAFLLTVQRHLSAVRRS